MCRILLVAVGLLLSSSTCVDVDVTEYESRTTVVYRRPKPPPPVRRPQPRPHTRRYGSRPKVPPPTHATARAAWMPHSEGLSARWTTIVLHHSATPSGNASLFDKFHRGKGWDELGYHFVIGKRVEYAGRNSSRSDRGGTSRSTAPIARRRTTTSMNMASESALSAISRDRPQRRANWTRSINSCGS